MKYAVILTFAIGAFAVPQNAASITSAPTSATPAPGLTPQVSCVLYSCSAGDVTCQASCQGLARPNESQAIDTNKCAAKCEQGDGSPSAATAFAQCVQGCINSLFPSSQTAFAPGNGAVASSVAAGASATGSLSPTASAASRLSGSGSGSAANPQQTGAADVISAQIAGAGLAGLLAVFAL